MNKHKFFIYQFFIILFCTMVSFCSAGVIIDPDTIEKVGVQGEQIKDVIVITNNQSKAVDVGVSISNWLKQEADPNQWLKVEPDVFSLEPGESKKIDYTVDVVSDMKGELMCMVFFSVSDKDKKTFSIGMQIGIPLYVAIKDTVDFKIEVEACKLQLEDGNLKGDILISNMSNVHLRPKIEALIEGLDENIYPVVQTKYGVPIRAGENKYYSFSKEITGNVPEQCNITATVKYGIGGMHDLELKRTFGNVKLQKGAVEEETVQETNVSETVIPGG